MVCILFWYLKQLTVEVHILNYFCHCHVWIVEGTYAYEYTCNYFANSGFLDWQL